MNMIINGPPGGARKTTKKHLRFRKHVVEDFIQDRKCVCVCVYWYVCELVMMMMYRSNSPSVNPGREYDLTKA